MTTSAILKAIHALPADEQMEIIEQVIHSLRVGAQAKTPTTARRTVKQTHTVKRKAKPDGTGPAGTKPEGPSPSGDPWFDDPRNIAIVMEGIKSARDEKCVTIEESPTLSKIFAKYSK